MSQTHAEALYELGKYAEVLSAAYPTLTQSIRTVTAHAERVARIEAAAADVSDDAELLDDKHTRVASELVDRLDNALAQRVVDGRVVA